MWAPPGQNANHNLWRYDVAKKSFMPPGTPSDPKGTQVEMPDDFTGTEPRGFHMMASPSGTQAPIEHINYTPETGEVHGRGVQAPPHMLNYTLMPEEALRPQTGVGQGQGSSPAMGMGAEVPSLGAFGSPQPFAGTPPLMSSPTMMGPSPTTNRAAPQWGGGGTPFDTRMGMGADDDDPTQPRGGGTATDTTDPDWLPRNEAGQPARPGDVIARVKGADGRDVAIQVYEGPNEFGTAPKFHWASGTSSEKAVHYHERSDGTVDVIDPSKTDPKTGIIVPQTVGTPDPDLIAKARDERAIQALNLKVAQANANVAAAKDANAAELARIELQKAQAEAATARSNADRAATEAAKAGQPPQATPKPDYVDRTGRVYQRNPDTGMYEPTDIYQQAGSWEKFNNPSDGMIHLYNPDTKEDQVLGPIDTMKEYPPMKVAGGKWIQWDVGKQGYKVLYQEGPDITTEWANDELIARDKNNPAAPPTVIWKKKPTRADDDAHDAAVDSHNKAMVDIEKTKADLITGRITAAEARVRMEANIQSLLHPQPVPMGGSTFYPAGSNVDVHYWDPMTGKTHVEHAGGGSVDPRVGQMVSQIDQFLGTLPSADTSAAKPPPAAKSSGTTPGLADDTGPAVGGRIADTSSAATTASTVPTVGAAMGGQDIRPGYPGYDPQHLGGSAQPPTTRTTGSGDTAHYDAQGNLTGIDYRNTSPIETGTELTAAPTDDPTSGEDEFYDERGRRRDSLGNYGGMGMGAGMSAGTTGWAPRPGVFAPATGPGFLGAGAAETEQMYDAHGNPIDDDAAPSSEVDPKLLQGGHQPPVDILPTPGHIANPGEIKGPGPAINTGIGLKLPGATDQGVNWNPDLKDVVTQKVNEPLKKIMGWPKLEHTPPEEGPPHGTQGGFDQPEIGPYDIKKRQQLTTDPVEPTDIGKKNKNVRDIAHILGEGGTGPEDWEELEAEGMGRGTGRMADPDAKRVLDDRREELRTTGVGQEGDDPTQPSDTMGTPGLPPSTQAPPQGPGGEQLPQWLLTLLRSHPELLQMAGLSGGQPAGGVSSPPTSPTPSAGWQPPTGQPPMPMGGGQDYGSSLHDRLEPIPNAPLPKPGESPYDKLEPIPNAPPPQPGHDWHDDLIPMGTGQGEMPPTGAPPMAPSPEGAPMTPPLDPSDVAGIGHRFGQEMNVGEPQHSGVDLQAPEGTPTQSPVDGFVARVENNPEGLGVTVVIRGLDGSEHRLGHLKETSAYEGMQVKMGQDLGSPVGDTGMTTGAHLHWGVRDEQGQPADPTQALGPMAQMPPVPGTEMMGPPGGVGGSAQMGAPQTPTPPMPMGGGQAGWRPRMGGGAEGVFGAQTNPALTGSTTWQAAMGGRGGFGGAAPAGTSPAMRAAPAPPPTRPAGQFAQSGAMPAQAQPPQPMPEQLRNVAGGMRMGGGTEMGAGASPEWAALQNQLQQTWSSMQQGQMSPGQMGARMAPQGSMFGVPQRPPQPPPTMQRAQPSVTPQAPPQGGQGGPSAGSQLAASLQPQGGGGQFARAGAMPARSPQQQAPSQGVPAQAGSNSPQVGWTPQ